MIFRLRALRYVSDLFVEPRPTFLGIDLCLDSSLPSGCWFIAGKNGNVVGGEPSSSGVRGDSAKEKTVVKLMPDVRVCEEVRQARKHLETLMQNSSRLPQELIIGRHYDKAMVDGAWRMCNDGKRITSKDTKSPE